MHNLVLKNIDTENAGQYRKLNVLISGATQIPPDSLLVPDYMEAMLVWYNNGTKHLHPVERSALLHGELVKIHPFTDGNGRTARLLMNLSLMQAGFIKLITASLKQSFEPYWFALGLADPTK